MIRLREFYKRYNLMMMSMFDDPNNPEVLTSKGVGSSLHNKSIERIIRDVYFDRDDTRGFFSLDFRPPFDKHETEILKNIIHVLFSKNY